MEQPLMQPAIQVTGAYRLKGSNADRVRSLYEKWIDGQQIREWK
jgi:hypothetical protein